MINNEIPTHCPGTQSVQAGNASACKGCPNRKICSSQQQIGFKHDPDVAKIAERLLNVKRKILVLSGKGGVGKSTVSAMLARFLANKYQNQCIGVLDIDLCGPSIPRLFGLQKEQVHQSGSGWSPVYAKDNLAVMSAGFLLPSPDSAVIWRGPKKNGLIKQLLRDVDWEDLECLLIDCPPGTSDEHLSIVQYLSQAGIDGAVLVTTSQELSLLDLRKEINFCRKVGLKILGVIENMRGFQCPGCHVTTTEILPATTGGAEKLCLDFNIPLLGKIPLRTILGRACDEGVDIFSANSEFSDIVHIYKQIGEAILTLLV